MRRSIALIALLLALAASGGCSARDHDAMTLSGRVVDDSVVLSAPPLAASKPATGTAFVGVGNALRLESVPVEVGEHVKTGDTVVVFDRAVLSARLESARAAYRVSALRPEVLDARISDVESGRATISENRRQVQEAISELASTRSGLVAQLSQARQQLQQLRGLQARLNRPLPPAEVPLPGSAPPDSGQVAANITRLETAIAQMEAGIARIDAGLRQAGTGLSRLEAADARAVDAQATLEGLKDVAGVAADVSAVAVRLAQARLSQAVLSSPVDGVVVSARQTGEVVIPAAPLIVLRPDAAPSVNVYVTPQQRDSLDVGDVATVRVDSMRAAGFSATVTYIAIRAQYPPSWLTTPETHMTRAFLVRVTLDDPTVGLPAGTPADVELSLDGSNQSGRDDEGN